MCAGMGVIWSHGTVIDYIELAVDDLEQAKAFYAKALGWTFNDYGPEYAGIQDPRNPGQEFGGLSKHVPASRGEGVLVLVRSESADDTLASVLDAEVASTRRWTSIPVDDASPSPTRRETSSVPTSSGSGAAVSPQFRGLGYLSTNSGALRCRLTNPMRVAKGGA